MAILTADQRANVRRLCANELETVTYNKSVINAAVQAIEDWFEDNRSSLNQALNTATSPTVLTAGQKRLLIKSWLLQKAGRE